MSRAARAERGSNPLSRALYRLIRYTVKRVYPDTRVEGLENLPEGPCVIVGNHAQVHGPIIAEVILPGRHFTWCAAEMMRAREVPEYAYRDFWSGKPKSVRWLFRIASYLIAPLAACVFGNADCIPVYHDARAISTFRESLARLSEGARVIIFPEENVPGNGIVWRFQRGFVDLARLYYGRTRQALRFVPMYVAPALRRVVLGAPVTYDPAAPHDAERERLCEALSDAIARTARELPPHRVVPYPNIPKDAYPTNRQ